MKFADQAFLELFPEKKQLPIIFISYSGKFNGFNANVSKRFNIIKFNLSKQWKFISPEIKKGLIQELLTKLYKKKQRTLNMDLYDSFIKNMSDYAIPTKTHPILENSFNRVNKNFFDCTIEQPNLKIGKGINRLGSFDYGTNTISISKILIENQELLDYVMFHELLHKVHKFKVANTKHIHHSRAFKKDEKSYPNAALLEKKLDNLIRKNKRFIFQFL